MSMSPSGPSGGPSGGPSNPSPGFGNQRTFAGRTQFNQSFMSSTAASSAPAVTQEMRDRQARGKHPCYSDDDSDDGDQDGGESGTTRFRLGRGRSEKEDFGQLERRQKAVAFLDSPELLMMYSQSTGQSVAAARLHFMKLLCGYDDETLQSSSSRAAYLQHLHSRQDRPSYPPYQRRGTLDSRFGAD
ncbi:hypothetical protein VTK26DRAFT_5577 [Humicola hyalothermophila]